MVAHGRIGVVKYGPREGLEEVSHMADFPPKPGWGCFEQEREEFWFFGCNLGICSIFAGEHGKTRVQWNTVHLQETEESACDSVRL